VGIISSPSNGKGSGTAITPNRADRFMGAVRSLFNITPSSSVVELEEASKKPKEVTAHPESARLEYGKVTRPGGSKEWNAPEFDFSKIAKCLASEAFFRRIVDKYIELIWRNGYRISGDNPTSTSYVIERLRQMAMVTRTPTDKFLRELTQQVVTYSNCFVEKVRNEDASGGRVRTTFDGKELKPVAGYFVVDATGIRVAKRKNGRVEKYKQVRIRAAEKEPEWRPEDMIHIVKDREAGLTFGTPMVAPVIDDIQALRRIEENAEMLVFNHAIPLYQYLVGDDLNRPSPEAIQKAKSTVRQMTTDGMLVTPYYHEVRAIGAEGRALRLEGILDHFKNRVFAGLGASEVALGYSGTASRSTAEALERGMFSTVREFQNVLKTAIQEEIIAELLMEGGFDPSVESIEFAFPEIDIDDRIKEENHIINLYNGNLITESEARLLMGKDPIKPEQRSDMFFWKVEVIRNVIRAVDEPFLLSNPGILKGITKDLSGRMASVKSLDMPSNQYGTKMAPGTYKDSAALTTPVLQEVGVEVVTDEITVEASRLLESLNYQDYVAALRRRYRTAEDDARKLIRERYVDGIEDSRNGNGYRVIDSLRDFDKGRMDMILDLTLDEMLKDSAGYVLPAFMAGVEDACRQLGVQSIAYNYSTDSTYLAEQSRKWLSSAFRDLKSSAEGIVRTTYDKKDAEGAIGSAFDSNYYRIRLGGRNELQRAFNIGTFRGGLFLGATKFSISHFPFDSDGKCRVHEGKAYEIGPDTDLAAIPPGYMTHPLCTCRVKLMR